MALALILAGCGEGGDAAASGGGAQAALPTAAMTGSMRPGLYRVVQTGDVEIEEERCVTAAQAASGRLPMSSSSDEGWTVHTNRAAAGRIAVSATHRGGGRMTLSGGYGADSFYVEGELTIPGGEEVQRLRIVQRGTLLSADCGDHAETDEADEADQE